jgi:hypothetical protein
LGLFWLDCFFIKILVTDILPYNMAPKSKGYMALLNAKIMDT